MEPITILIIVSIYFIATFFSSITGGAGLLTTPVLIFFGLSPHLALGTNKIGGIGTTSGAALGYGMQKRIDYKMGLIFMAFASAGAIFGTFVVLSIPGGLVKKIIGVTLIIASVYFFINKDVGIKTEKTKRNMIAFGLFALGSGIYSGFYGAGIGTINRFIFAAFFSYTMINSSALSSFANISTNVISLLIFSFYGAVQYALFIPIILASFIGSYLGSIYAVKLGDAKIKYILLAVSMVMGVSLLVF